MKKCLMIWIGLLMAAFSAHAQTDTLYETVARLDSLFFRAYNTCDIATQAAFYSDSIEFYHDRGGLTTSKKDLLESTQKYICGNVTRQLTPGSLEVSPIPGFGAVEFGYHTFYNRAEPDAQQKASKFVIIWQNAGGVWTIRRVISLH